MPPLIRVDPPSFGMSYHISRERRRQEVTYLDTFYTGAGDDLTSISSLSQGSGNAYSG